MTTMHLFTVRDEVQMPLLTPFDCGDAVRGLEGSVNEWLSDSSIRHYVNTPFRQFYVGEKVVGYEAPTYRFYDELDAVMFKLVWGNEFDCSVYDQ